MYDGRANPRIERCLRFWVSHSLALSPARRFPTFSVSVCVLLYLKHIPSLQRSPTAFNLYRSNVLLRPDVVDGRAYFQPAGGTKHWKNTEVGDFSTFSWALIYLLSTTVFFFWLFLLSNCSCLCCFISPYCRKFDFYCKLSSIMYIYILCRHSHICCLYNLHTPIQRVPLHGIHLKSHWNPIRISKNIIIIPFKKRITSHESHFDHGIAFGWVYQGREEAFEHFPVYFEDAARHPMSNSQVVNFEELLG